ncbi:hypothetical protein B7R22_01985 [Subtercola boreus]|uniref:Erythromycin biosynthesis protein CIII-like C-terminal domain-containing protein n=1 Tax=Subtercola boreus TaxID=120213 RepID=A0A3E0W507_9MICO|nr:hypothetical protein B7R22_01985 [Subtercola boreus]
MNREAEVDVVAEYFAGDAARQSADAVEKELPWADVIVCDELDFGAMGAGARAGLPVVVVSVIASGALVRDERISGALERLGVALGLAQQFPHRGNLFVVPFAPRMRDPKFPAPSDVAWMRPAEGKDPAPNGSVVATLGTEFNTESGDLFDRVLRALAGLNAPTVVAVGRDLDPARFGRQPPHERVERYIDLESLIPQASVVLHHGGSGLFMRSVLGGASQIVFPMGADRPFTADRVDSLGIGRVLDPLSATPDLIRDAVAALRDDGTTRNNVLALRSDVLGLPDSTIVVRRVETLADNAR